MAFDKTDSFYICFCIDVQFISLVSLFLLVLDLFKDYLALFLFAMHACYLNFSIMFLSFFFHLEYTTDLLIIFSLQQKEKKGQRLSF